jgi:hypothetical protein
MQVKWVSGIYTKRVKKISWILAFLILLNVSFSAPESPKNFYGDVLINGKPAKISTDVVVFSEGKICGRYLTQIDGKYGILNCNANSNEDFYFEVNSEKAKAEFISKENVNLYTETKKRDVPEYFSIILLVLLIFIFIYFIIRELDRRGV